ncbi:protein GLUTAMINE DUMPER 5-like [Cucurbita moschata]|uniref:Protein GLUTAMINE DUMPER 5-like n=1 Tax=Cucurbita moschata TaxID=3662 RepID=A0A6J1FQY3_CUCMO|nr:protein GLUTAMINE DUMPER 5-like [Cucurbita moschata]
MESISPSSAQFSSPSPGVNIAERVQWHSPLPYLFGGLAAMLSLIAFALVILACSYWNLSRQDRDSGDLESGGGNDAKIDSETSLEKVNNDEKVLVIMAGHQNPTFIATPVCVKVSSSEVDSAANSKSEEKETAENSEKSNKDCDREANTAVQESVDEQNE